MTGGTSLLKDGLRAVGVGENSYGRHNEVKNPRDGPPSEPETRAGRVERSLMFPYVTTTTAGVILVLQILLAFTVSGGRGKVDAWIGSGGDAPLERAIRRHGNLAENGGIFVASFLLLELSRFSATLLISLCAAFVVARLFHAAGLSRENTRNPFRMIGGVGTYLIGLTLGGTLVWVGANAALRSMQ